VSGMRWVRIAGAEEIPPGAARTFDVDGRPIAVANVNGSLYAIDDLCTHDDGPLGDGRVTGYSIECPRHGARFDVRTGAVLRMPAVAPIRTWRVRVEGAEILVEVEA
jgi:3-phenylpropionate/trans-cinnamate dioxygenase ferredoxin subunit